MSISSVKQKAAWQYVAHASCCADCHAARQCVEPAFCHADYDILIAAGGDGTINQVVNELVQQDAPKETCLAVLPLGTANDFATSLTIPDDNLVQAMQTAVQGTYLCDINGHCVLMLS